MTALPASRACSLRERAGTSAPKRLPPITIFLAIMGFLLPPSLATMAGSDDAGGAALAPAAQDRSGEETGAAEAAVRMAAFDQRDEDDDQDDRGSRSALSSHGADDPGEGPAYDGASARIRFLEGDLNIQRADDDAMDSGSLNTPIFPGDRASTGTGGRAEIQLPSAALVRLDQRSAMTFLSLPRPGSKDEDTVLQLSEGSAQIEIRGRLPRDVDFRIDTPSASVYLLASGRYRIDIEGKYGKARISSYRGVTEVVGDDGSVMLRSGQRTFVESGGQPETPRAFNTVAADFFEGWIADRNGGYQREDREARDERAERGDREDVDEEDLPDPVRPYRTELSYYGDWVTVEPYGPCWVPASVYAGWRPYSNGYWSYGPSGNFWVSYDPWGWAPYHYGRWFWAAGRGWAWIPGNVFSGAWVSWYYSPTYIGWGPLDYWDYPCAFSLGYRGFDYRCWNFVTYQNVFVRNVRNVYVKPKVVRVGVSQGGGVIVRHPVRLTPRDLRENRVTPAIVVKRAQAMGRGAQIAPADLADRSGKRSFKETERVILQSRLHPHPAVRGGEGRRGTEAGGASGSGAVSSGEANRKGPHTRGHEGRAGEAPPSSGPGARPGPAAPRRGREGRTGLGTPAPERAPGAAGGQEAGAGATPGAGPKGESPRMHGGSRLPVRPRESAPPGGAETLRPRDADDPRGRDATDQRMSVRPRMRSRDGQEDAVPEPRNLRPRVRDEQRGRVEEDDQPDRNLRQFFRESERRSSPPPQGQEREVRPDGRSRADREERPRAEAPRERPRAEHQAPPPAPPKSRAPERSHESHENKGAKDKPKHK